MTVDSARSKAFIMHELNRLQKMSSEYFSVGPVNNDNIYVWEVLIFGPKDTPYEGGIFTARMMFPVQYPESPPTFKFISEMYHPNIDKDGNVCISILHKPGDDEYGYEKLCERWMPVQNPESVIMSIVSLLSSPNCESPASLEAARDYRERPEVYNKKVRRLAQKTLE